MLEERKDGKKEENEVEEDDAELIIDESDFINGVFKHLEPQMDQAQQRYSNDENNPSWTTLFTCEEDFASLSSAKQNGRAEIKELID